MAGIPVWVKLIDADDPSSNIGPIDPEDSPITTVLDLSDNFEALPWAQQQLATVVGPNQAVATTTVKTSKHPGDNYRAVAVSRPAFLSLVKPVVQFAPARETEGRVFFDTDNDDVHDSGEPILDGAGTVVPRGPKMFTSELLTVWRKLFVEVDSMGAPDPNKLDTHYGFDATYPIDDPRPGDLPDAPANALTGAFYPAFVEVHILGNAPASGATADNPNQSDLEFVKQVGVGTGGVVDGHQALFDDLWWTVRIVTIYEASDFHDNDDLNAVGTASDDEFSLTGFSPPNSHVAYIFYEPLRDVAWENDWTDEDYNAYLDVLVIHEVGHTFGLLHHGAFLSNVMAPPSTDNDELQPVLFTPLIRSERGIARFPVFHKV